MLNEFKSFIMRGNVVDMAVGLVIGAAFGKIVTSFVNDLLMPPIGILIGGIDFSHLAIVLRPATATAKAVTINYGAFINNIIDFLIVGMSIYLVVKGMNSLKKAPVPEPTEKKCPHCMMMIPIQATKCAHCTSNL